MLPFNLVEIKGTLRGEPITITEHKKNVNAPFSWDRSLKWDTKTSYLQFIKASPVELKRLVLEQNVSGSYMKEGLIYSKAIELNDYIGRDNTKILCAASLFHDIQEKSNTKIGEALCKKYANWLVEYMDVDFEKTQWLIENINKIKPNHLEESEEVYEKWLGTCKGNKAADIALLFREINESATRFKLSEFSNKYNLNNKNSSLFNGLYSGITIYPKGLNKIGELKENLNYMDTIMTSAMNSAEGIKKYILENLQRNVEDKTIDEYKRVFKHITNKDFDKGMLNEMKYEKELMDFYYQHQREIDSILDKSNWIKNTKKKWLGAETLSDIIAEGAAEAISISAGELYSEIF